MGVRNKKSNDLFFWYNAITTINTTKGDIAHGHYTLFTSIHSIPT